VNQSNQLPAFIAASPRRNLAERVTANLGTSAPPYLSIRDNRFTLVDAAGNEQPVTTYEADPGKCAGGQKPGPYIDVCIVDVNDHISRIYYDVPYDPNATSYQPPACFSHNGIGPSRSAAKPQSLTCAACPNAVWGSATSNVSGKPIPACGQYQFIAFLAAMPPTQPGATLQPAHTHPFLLRVPPNTLKNFRAYAEMYNGKAFNMHHVITRISFESQGTLVFAAVGFAEAFVELDRKLVEERAYDVIVGRTDMTIEAMPALPIGGQHAQIGQSAQPAQPAQPALTPPASWQPPPVHPPIQPVQPQLAQPQSAQPAQSQPVQPQPAQPAARGGRGSRRAPPPPVAPFMQASAQTSQGAAQPGTDHNTANGGQSGIAPGAPPNPEMEKMLGGLFNS